MPVNPLFDSALLEEAHKLSGRRTRRETVEEAHREYVRRRKQQEIVALFGKIVYEKGYDFKRARAPR